MKTIGFVDDEESIRNGYIKLINWTEAGFKVKWGAANGVEAMCKLEADPVDLIITDIRMPMMNGLELARLLSREYPQVKKIFLSAYNDMEYVNEGMACGVDGYILKTEDEDTFVEYLKKLHAKMTDAKQTLAVQAVEYIAEHYMKKLTLKRVADSLGIHPGHLSRILQKSYNKTFVDILTEKRIEKAEKLLAQSNMKIYEISEACGYSKTRYFSNLFRKLSGVTPQEYRRATVYGGRDDHEE